MTPTDQLLQSYLNNLLCWSTSSNLLFNSSKSCHLSFNQKFITSYTITNCTAIPKQCHKYLKVTISMNLDWSTHHDIILSKVYKALRRTFSPLIQPLTKAKLWITIPISTCILLSNSAPILIKDINKLEYLQIKASHQIHPERVYLWLCTYLNSLTSCFFIISIKSLTDSSTFFISYLSPTVQDLEASNYFTTHLILTSSVIFILSGFAVYGMLFH